MSAAGRKDIAIRVYKLLSAASNIPVERIKGTDNIGMPPPLGIPPMTLYGMVPALNDIIKSYGGTPIGYSDISGLAHVSDLIGKMWGWCHQ